jgi:hypothetical protein
MERLLAGTTVGLRGETTMAAKLRERSQPKQILRNRMLFLGSSSPLRSDVETAQHRYSDLRA